MAVRQRIEALHLPDNAPKRPLEEMEPASFFLSLGEHQMLRSQLIVLVERIITDRIPALRKYRGSVIRHIPHKYFEISKQKTEQVTFILICT